MSQLATSTILQNKWPALAEGAAAVGSVQIRHLATLGGNICNASPAADTLPALLALAAQAELTGPSGQRTIPLDQFFTGPGQTVLQRAEILTGLLIPVSSENIGSVYLRRCIRRQLDLAAVGVAAAISLTDAGRISQVRLALGAVAPTPIRAYAAEQAILAAGALNEQTLTEAAHLAQQAARPISDLRASAAYRRQMVGVLTRRALHTAYERAIKLEK